MHDEIRTMTDGERVLHTATLLEISEYEVFRRGHLEWFGKDPDPDALEQDFVRYLYFGETPPSVRHYTRSTLGASGQQFVTTPSGGPLSQAWQRLSGGRLARFLSQ